MICVLEEISIQWLCFRKGSNHIFNWYVAQTTLSKLESNLSMLYYVVN
jgi:hypothetical protein